MTKPGYRIVYPQPGFATVSLAKGAWAVPARITQEDGLWVFVIDGTPYPPMTDDEVGSVFEGPIYQLLMFGVFCDEATYLHRLATKAWAQTHSPQHPAANPLRRIDTRLLRSEDF